MKDISKHSVGITFPDGCEKSDDDKDVRAGLSQEEISWKCSQQSRSYIDGIFN